MIEAHEATRLRRPFVDGAQRGRLPLTLYVRAGKGGIHQHGPLARVQKAMLTPSRVRV
jgi:hypothetical protein